uniref:Uncharacterized protein n=1 Tax=Anguilla anguilla TaxID=7936 RepID=A0A0E9UF29_ANGAN
MSIKGHNFYLILLYFEGVGVVPSTFLGL